MSADPISASKAYLEAAKAALRTQGGGAKETESVDFGQMVQHAIADAAQSSRHAEKASMAAVAGKADIVDVVTAIAQAETSLETVIAVRDQVIQAYQEIMRMPI